MLPPALVTLGRDHPGLELMVTELEPAIETWPLLAETVYLASLNE